jgi:hypothetical protein
MHGPCAATLNQRGLGGPFSGTWQGLQCSQGTRSFSQAFHLQRVQEELDETVSIRSEAEAGNDPEFVAECRAAEDRLRVRVLCTDEV